MKILIKSRAELDNFIKNCLDQHNSSDHQGWNLWADISDTTIKNIQPPKSYPALLSYYAQGNNSSCWDDLHYEYVTKEDLGLDKKLNDIQELVSEQNLRNKVYSQPWAIIEQIQKIIKE